MKNLSWIVTSLLIVAGCSSSSDEQKLLCNEVNFIDAFPKEVELEAIRPLSLDLAGCVDVFSIDTLMIFKMMNGEYFWKVYSLNNNRFLGHFLAKGHGDNEFVSLPCSATSARPVSASALQEWRLYPFIELDVKIYFSNYFPYLCSREDYGESGQHDCRWNCGADAGQ